MFENVIHRIVDDSYVITKNNMPYHVPNEGKWKSLWNDVNEYAQNNPKNVTIEYPKVPTQEDINIETQQQYTNFIQQLLDAEAQNLGYDNCLSVCSYMDTGVQKFDDEGSCFRKWRSAVWNTGYEILDKVKSGKMEIPSEEKLIKMLPKLEIVYSK